MGPAAIASRWRHSLSHLKTVSSPNVLISVSRWLSESTATQTFDPENVVRPPVPTEAMFGLPKRGPRAALDGEDLIGGSAQVGPKKKKASEISKPSTNAEQENYFSKAWAAQKNLSKWPWLRVSEQHIHQREFLLSDTARQAQGHGRVWQYASDIPEFAQDKFIIASYNVLASTFARQQKFLLYKHVPGALLDWKTRRPKIIFELGLCSPDIICLQEVDRFKDLEEELAFKGYAGVYKERTGVAPDGCAMFWRTKRFKLLHEESVEFSAMGLRDNVAQFCVFESLVSGPVEKESTTGSRMEGGRKDHCLIVGNIHLLYNPKRGDIKLGQCRTFLEKAHMLSCSWRGAPIVIGGDFNSTPSSAIYDFLATSELEVSGLDRSYLSGQIIKVGNSAFTDSKANGARKSSPQSCASSQLILEAMRSIEILKSTQDSKVPQEQTPESMEDKAHLSEETHVGDGQTPKHDNHQVKEIPGLSSGTACWKNLDTNTDIRNMEFPVKGKFLHSTEDNEDLDVSNLVKEGLDKNKLLPHAASDGHMGSDCSPLYMDGEERNVAVIGENVNQCSNTSALNTQELTSLSNYTSHGSLEENISKSSGRLTLGDENISLRNDSPFGQVLEESSVEMNNNDGMAENEIQWDLDELRTATGDPECTVIQHKLNLCSVYSEVQGKIGTRDEKGEPLITTYNTMFRGTVDYIWRSDGLKPVRVLETVPPEGMLVHKGLPTKVWGSDHLAIACELAFTSNQTGLGSRKVEAGV